ncbi:tetratricopeptide repeat protein [Desulfovibrio piger]|nr:tetratricopeptide repeat protein [Desulfovibrio piger]
MKHAFLLLFLIAELFSGTPSRCDTVENDADSMEQAVDTIKKAAEQGDASAQYKLGVLYIQGVGMMQNSARACYWYRKAAEQGQTEAQYMLGLMFSKGEGVPQDFVQARQWWEKAAAKEAETGDTNVILSANGSFYFNLYVNGMAEYSLGELYSKGLGVSQDDDKARQWWEKAAAKGFITAQLHLGFLYYKGESVKQDYGMARQWWEKAAAQHNPSAQVLVGSLYEHGEGVNKDCATAREWFDEACRGGFQEGCAALEGLNCQ